MALTEQQRAQLDLPELFTFANPDNTVRPVAGPQGLPYIALFRAPEAAGVAFGQGELPPMQPVRGAWAMNVAYTAGFGLTYQTGSPDEITLTHGQVRDTVKPPNPEDGANARRPLDLSGAAPILVAEPNVDFVPEGLRAAMTFVLATQEGAGTAWLVMVLQGDVRALVLVVRSKGNLDGQNLVNRLTWATPDDRPVHLMVDGGGVLGPDAMANRAPLYVDQE